MERLVFENKKSTVNIQSFVKSNATSMVIKLKRVFKLFYKQLKPLIKAAVKYTKLIDNTRYGRYVLVLIFVGLNIFPILLAKNYTEGSKENRPINNQSVEATPTPTLFTTQGLRVDEASAEFTQARSYSLDENLLMDLLNQERKRAGARTLKTDDIEVCIVAQSALTLIINLNRIPTNEELEKVDLGMLGQREIHFAHAVGFDDEAQVIEYFNKDETVRKIITNRMFNRGCIKAKYGFAVLAATY